MIGELESYVKDEVIRWAGKQGLVQTPHAEKFEVSGDLILSRPFIPLQNGPESSR